MARADVMSDPTSCFVLTILTQMKSSTEAVKHTIAYSPKVNHLWFLKHSPLAINSCNSCSTRELGARRRKYGVYMYQNS